MWQCSDKVQDHFLNPRNVGVLEQADAEGQAGTIAFGDALKIAIKVDPDSGVITDARFKSFGCGVSIAAASALTEIVIGKTIDDASAVSDADIVDYLGGLPDDKMYCAVLGQEALQTAIAHYRGQNGADDSETICKCFPARKAFLERIIRANKLTLPGQVTNYTKVSGGCQSCKKPIEALLAEVNADMVEEGILAAADAYQAPVKASHFMPAKFQMNGNGAPAKPNGVTEANGKSIGPGIARPNAAPTSGQEAQPTPQGMAAFAKLNQEERIEVVSKAIDELRPHLKADGGDCELVEVKENTAYVRLTGACMGCQMASVTLSGVQQRLIEKTGMPLRVVPVQ
ncbi:iron-sulfur cluster assembly scaffold protein [Methyloceanibacter sp. wino2]|uniref:iron-sulfur cluster assembly scaffold protein n=1 Tax=Methyloceanibacter sp. wino2 TaxID=2170729 RepID=UPI000D3E8E90|nr:iron-sulfur cluster assembly scaffold protein [Methyloceanibacter sp. wino2]